MQSGISFDITQAKSKKKTNALKAALDELINRTVRWLCFYIKKRPMTKERHECLPFTMLNALDACEHRLNMENAVNQSTFALG